MAWTTVTHACGHDTEHQLHGRSSRREWIAQRESERLCSDCFRAALDSERATQRAAAHKAAEEAGWPALTGTDKQVDWAVVIRHTTLTPSLLDHLAAHESWTPLCDLIAEALGQITSAKWWIDSRDRLASVGEALMALADRPAGDQFDAALWQQALTLAFPDRDWSGTWLFEKFVPTGWAPNVVGRPLDDVAERISG